MRQFRLLRADEIECRISEVNRSGKGVALLLYKTARTDSSLLDETFGAMNWDVTYQMIGARLYCGIGVNADGTWVRKWNVGTESNADPEKGQASDALKRAGFTWGIGTELYSAPRIFVPASACHIEDRNGKKTCYDRFEVLEIAYDERENISKLVIENESTNKVCFVWQAPESKKEEPVVCAACGREIAAYTTEEGKTITPKRHASGSMKRFGQVLCLDCIERRTNENAG